MVFSDAKKWLGPGIETTNLGISLLVPTDADHSPLNSEVFMKAWELIREDGRYETHDWTVKVDPDVVFIPERLRSHLKQVAPKPGVTPRLYIKNCRPAVSGLYGALEILSRPAVEAYFIAKDDCKKILDWNHMGEDVFMSKCLDIAKVTYIDVFGMLDDEFCGEDPSSCSSGAVAFHKFAKVDAYTQCLEEAGWHKEQTG